MQKKTIEVSMEELKQLIDQLLLKAMALGYDKVELDTDYYWTILSSDRENFQSEPKPAVGSLVSDVEDLQLVLDGKHDLTPLDFDRLANVLITVGEHVSSAEKPWLIEK